LNESGQHPFDFDGIRSELFVKSCWKELKVFGEQQMVLQFAGGTAFDGAETSERGFWLLACCRGAPWRPRPERAAARNPKSEELRTMRWPRAAEKAVSCLIS
jgi:hypothetical protein